LAAELSRLRSPAAVQAALDEFSRAGRVAFLEHYGFGRSRDYLVRNPRTGELCDSKAVVGAAFGYEYPEQGPLRPGDFSGGAATVVPRLQALGFEVVRVGEDWSESEVASAVAAYFDMLRLEATQQPYNKSERNLALRQLLGGRSKASVEMKHQNVSAVLDALGLPFIPGYKPRINAQLMLRKEVQRFVLSNPSLVQTIVDAMEEAKPRGDKRFEAMVVAPPVLEDVVRVIENSRTYLPRKVDFAARDEANRRLGRAGEQWVLQFEQQRLAAAGMAALFERVDWVSERLGDGAGYDILSFDGDEARRYIEVKTTNGGLGSSFIVSRNELEFSRDAGEEFHLYRLFAFREAPRLYTLKGDLSRQVHLEPLDYRASFRKLVSAA
jgi:hypothetical protein